MPRISQHSFVACQFFSSKNAKVSFSSFSSVGVLSFSPWYYFSFSLPLLLRSRPHVPRFDFRLSLLSERGFISRAAAGNQVNTWYDLRSCTKSIIAFHAWLRKHFFASKIVLQVIVCFRRGVGSMSSSRRVPRSFHRTVFFGAPLAFLRVVKCFLSLYPFPRGVAKGLICGCIIFMFLLLRFFFSSTELHKRQQ